MSTTDSTVSAVHNPARRRKRSKDLEPPVMRIILLGKDVSANSRVGNFMLGRSAFDSEAPPDEHQIERVIGKDMMIINCPHLLQLNLSYHQITQTVRECVDLSHPGPHLILLIFKPDECSREDQEHVEMILNYFSDGVYQHTLVLTTHDSHSLHHTEVNDIIKEIIKKCFNKHYRLKKDNTAAQLIETLRDIIKSNDGRYLICDEYDDAKSFTMKQQTDERRIVLLGKTGVGKSATGNTILNREAFISRMSFVSVTKECQRETAEINKRLITVIDTPGLFDTELSHEEIKREMMNCISMILPGPHVFIIVLNLTLRLTEEESRSVKIIQEMFGENSLMHTMVLFTRGDQLRNQTIEDYYTSIYVIRNLLEECGNRYHVFNNTQTEDRTQVSLLLEKIDDMVKANGGSYYSITAEEYERKKEKMKKITSQSLCTVQTYADLKAQGPELRTEQQQQTMSNNLRSRGNQLSEQSPNNEAAAAVQNRDPINIVLLGKTGVGKSSSGNTILGETRFRCGRSLSSITKESSAVCKEIDGRNVNVIDTPGFDPTLSKESLAREFARSVYLSTPGVNAFLFVVPFGRFTEQEVDILNRVKKIFGGDVLKHVIILFTYGDECDHETVDSEIDQNQVVKKVIESCRGYHIINNRDLNNRRQVTELLQKILLINAYYTHEMYDWAQKSTFEKFWHYW